MDEKTKAEIMMQTDWVMNPKTLTEQCDIKLLILLSDLLGKQKSSAEEQIACLKMIIDFIEKMIAKRLEDKPE
jgi:hypothetical protein